MANKGERVDADLANAEVFVPMNGGFYKFMAREWQFFDEDAEDTEVYYELTELVATIRADACRKAVRKAVTRYVVRRNFKSGTSKSKEELIPEAHLEDVLEIFKDHAATCVSCPELLVENKKKRKRLIRADGEPVAPREAEPVELDDDDDLLEPALPKRRKT